MSLALGPEPYRRVLRTTEHGGYVLLEHLRASIGGPFVWAPGVDGAVVVGQRGGDFLFEAGEDLSVGYDSHDGHGRARPAAELHVPRRHPEAGLALLLE